MASVAATGNDQPRISWESGGRNAWNQFVEIGIARHIAGLGRGHCRLTPWHNSTDGEGGYGIALNLDQELRTPESLDSGPLIGFFRAGIGDAEVTPAERFVSSGLLIARPFGRVYDEWAFGVAWSDASPSAGVRSETLVETYYRFALSRSLAMTPDVQIVIDSANSDDADAVLVLGLRLHLQL